MSKKAKKSKRKSPLRFSVRERQEGSLYDEELTMMEEVLKSNVRTAISSFEEDFPFDIVYYGRGTLSYALEPWRESTKPETGIVSFSRRRKGYKGDFQSSKKFYFYYPIGNVLASIYIAIDTEANDFVYVDDVGTMPASDAIAAKIVALMMNDCEYSYVARFNTMMELIKRIKDNTFTKGKIMKLAKPFGIDDASLIDKCLDVLYLNGQLTYKAADDFRRPPSEARGNPPFYFIKKEGDN